MKTKTIIHRRKPGLFGYMYPPTVCGRGTGGDGNWNATNRDEKVTCGRCKLLAKFAAKRAKKGKR